MNFGIRTKIVVFTAAIMAFSIGASILASGYIFTREHTASMQSRSLAIAKSLRFQLDRILHLGIRLEEIVGFEEQCREIVANYEGIKYAMVTNVQGKILFHNDPSYMGKVSVDPPTLAAIKDHKERIRFCTECLEDDFEVIVPVLAPGREHVGAVRVGFPIELVQRKTREMASLSIGTGLASIGAAVLLLLFVLSVLVTKPLTELLNRVRAIKARGAESAGHVEIGYHDEIGDLAQAFNDMTDDLSGTTVSRDYVNNIIGGMSDSLIVADPNAVIKSVNKAACAMLGYEPEELQGKPLDMVFGSPGEVSFFREGSGFLERGIDNFETVYRKKNGAFIPVLFSVSLMKDKEGKVSNIICTGRDITGRKMMEEEQAKVRTLESVGILAGGIAHDFNNLLASILGNISLARNNPKDGERLSRLLAQAEKSCEQASELSYRLLTFSGGGALIKELVTIGPMVEETVAAMSFGPRIAVETDLPEGLYTIKADERQLKQVIRNLLVNAVEAMPHGGRVRIRGANTVLTENDRLPLPGGKYLKISVDDQGVGIAEENMVKLFDPYFTTKEMGNRKGLGLGLAVAYAVIKKHDGQITVESNLGHGATFTIYLPAAVS